MMWGSCNILYFSWPSLASKYGTCIMLKKDEKSPDIAGCVVLLDVLTAGGWVADVFNP